MAAPRSRRDRGWPRCSVCGRKKPSGSFAPSSRTRSGLDSVCRACRRAREEQVRQRSCETKTAYPSQQEAARAATFAPVRLRPYPCPWGPHWHLSSR